MGTPVKYEVNMIYKCNKNFCKPLLEKCFDDANTFSANTLNKILSIT